MGALAGLRPRIAACDRPRGDRSRDLSIGPWRLRFEGLDAVLDESLAYRWGAFWGPAQGIESVTVRVVRGDGATWVPAGPPGERYRIEAETDADGILVASYRFALATNRDRSWRLALEDAPQEPIPRLFENATRYLVARLAAEQGGVALHGAGIARNGRAWIFAGPSRSGKSTAIRLTQGESLGDDFAVVLPSVNGFSVPAVPFDNAETGVASSPPAPLAMILRLHQGPKPILTRPTGPMAHAALMACLAFPWALPDLSAKLDAAVAALVSGGRFGELTFAPDPSFWELLES
jgi:hypothetical protein